MSLTISDLRLDDEFDQLFALYHRSLPACERKSKSELRAMSARPDYRFLVARHPSTIVAIAVLYTGRCSLLEYLAVDSAHRGQGIGQAMFEHISRMAQPLLIEVDAAQGSQTDAKRQHFYHQRGARLVKGLNYILPLKPNPPPMKLMLFSQNESMVISKSLLRQWITEIYVQVYHCSKDDPRIQAMLAPVCDPVVLE